MTLGPPSLWMALFSGSENGPTTISVEFLVADLAGGGCKMSLFDMGPVPPRTPYETVVDGGGLILSYLKAIFETMDDWNEPSCSASLCVMACFPHDPDHGEIDCQCH